MTTATPDFLPVVRTETDSRAVQAALAEIAGVVGVDQVMTGDGGEFRDPYQPLDWDAFAAAGVVFPRSSEHVQHVPWGGNDANEEIVRLVAKEKRRLEEFVILAAKEGVMRLTEVHRVSPVSIHTDTAPMFSLVTELEEELLAKMRASSAGHEQSAAESEAAMQALREEAEKEQGSDHRSSSERLTPGVCSRSSGARAHS